MIEYFAGRYLISAGIITRHKLDELLAWLRVAATDSTKISQDTLMRDNQVNLIRMLQNTIDEKLGDLASDYSSLTSEQTYSMTKKQHVLNMAFFNQLLVSGALTVDNLSQELEKFRNYYALNLPGISRNLKDDFDSILSSFIHAGDYYANEYAKIALKYIMRFVGTRVSFGEASGVFSFSAERIAIQKVVTADKRYFLGIAGDKKFIQSFNDGIQSSFNSHATDSRYTALIPFLNCITNIFQCLIALEKEVIFQDKVNVYKYSTIFVNDHCDVLTMSVEDMKLSLVIGYGERPNFATISHNI